MYILFAKYAILFSKYAHLIQTMHMGSSTEIATIKWYALFSSTE